MDIGGENKEQWNNIIKEILEHWNEDLEVDNEQKD